MSYSDYLAGLRDGFAIGFSVGVEVGWRAGQRSGYLSGYSDGYRDASLGLPYKPKERLQLYESLVPEPPKLDPSYLCKPKPLPVIEYEPPKYLAPELPKYEPLKPLIPEPLKFEPPKCLTPEPIKSNYNFLDEKPYWANNKKLKNPWEY